MEYSFKNGLKRISGVFLIVIGAFFVSISHLLYVLSFLLLSVIKCILYLFGFNFKKNGMNIVESLCYYSLSILYFGMMIVGWDKRPYKEHIYTNRFNKEGHSAIEKYLFKSLADRTLAADENATYSDVLLVYLKRNDPLIEFKVNY